MPNQKTSTGAVAMAAPPRRSLPAPLRYVRAAALVIVAVHLTALALLLLHQDVVAATVAADHPALTGQQLDDQTRQTLLQSVIPHVLIPLLLIWRARSLRTGRPRARIGLTVLLTIQLLAHATLPMVLDRLPGYGPAIIAVQAFSLVFEVLTLVMLWRPAASSWFRRDRLTAEPDLVSTP